MNANHSPIPSPNGDNPYPRVNLIRRIAARCLLQIENEVSRAAHDMHEEEAFGDIVFGLMGWRQRLNPGVWV